MCRGQGAPMNIAAPLFSYAGVCERCCSLSCQVVCFGAPRRHQCAQNSRRQGIKRLCLLCCSVRHAQSCSFILVSFIVMSFIIIMSFMSLFLQLLYFWLMGTEDREMPG